MKKISNMALMVIGLVLVSVSAKADDDYWYRSGNSPDIEVWTNKGDDAQYYYGEDVAVYFQTDDDCYAVVYDVDPSGEVNILFPSSIHGSSYVRGGQVYRVPDYNEDFRLEVSGTSGREHIFAVASYDYMNPPDFMKYVGYDYGNDSYYSDDYFVVSIRGELSNFVASINARICDGSYSVAHTKFNVDTRYRHHRQYRYWDYDPYNVASVWVGCDWPGSEVWIDGVFWGIAPVFVPRVIVGYHWVWVYYGGYPCYQRYFYVPAYQRFQIDVRIDNHYRDRQYRRQAFRHWVFEEKKYRNEDGFKERAREVREKSVRTRSLPSSVVRDYTDRGIIKKDSPLAKDVRSRAVDRDNSAKPILGVEKPERAKNTERVGEGKAEKSWRGKQSGGVDKSDRNDIDDSRVIIPEKARQPEISRPVENSGGDDKGGDRKIENSRGSQKGRDTDSDKSQENKIEKKRSSGSSNEGAKKEKSVTKDDDRKSSRDSKESSGKSSKTSDGKARRR